jgi:hypothetical protein
MLFDGGQGKLLTRDVLADKLLSVDVIKKMCPQRTMQDQMTLF